MAKEATQSKGDPRDEPTTTSAKAVKVMEQQRPNPLEQFAKQPEAQLPARLQVGGALFDQPQGAIQVAVYRDEARIMDKLKVMAAVAGDDWYYRFPVTDKNNVTSYIEGASIKLAMTLSRLWGNCMVDARVIDLGDEWMIYARFQDFETGYVLVRPFQQRKSQKTMKTDADRQRDIALSIGVSKAERNVVVQALSEFAKYGHEEAKFSLVEKIGKDLPAWRTKVIDRFQEEGIDIARAERVVGRVVAEWLAPDVAKVIATAKAVTDGMSTWDQSFPVMNKPLNEAEKAAGDGVKQFAEGGKGEAVDTTLPQE